MKYVLDATALLFLLEKFPRRSCKEIWEKFIYSCGEGTTISTDQVKEYLKTSGLSSEDKISWLDENKIFKIPTPIECEILAKYIKEGKFNYYINSNEIYRNLPYSTPFSIVQAKASGRGHTLIIDKQSKDAEKIITICNEIDLTCIDYDEYLEAL